MRWRTKLRQCVNIQKEARHQYSIIVNIQYIQNFVLAELTGDLTDFTKKYVCVYFLQNTVGTYFLNNQVDIAPAYEGRAFLEVNMDEQVSTLRLTKVKVEDSRRFQCSVTIPNDDEGNTRAFTSLLVLGENVLLFNTFWIAVYIYSMACYSEDAKFIHVVGPLVMITTFYTMIWL